MRYAGFWKRFVAGWIDSFVLLLPTIFLVWLQSVSRPLAFITLFPSTFLFYAYEIYFHGRCGQTIGKRNQNIRVVTVNGNPITWKQAFLRSSIGLALGILWVSSILVALLQITDEEFTRLSWLEMVERQNQLAPYSMEINIATFVWVWSEVIVLLFNRKKRALHDFIAGTVVRDESYQLMETTDAPDTDAI
jgi:uncharacterized RDD family membrane protein YckC